MSVTPTAIEDARDNAGADLSSRTRHEQVRLLKDRLFTMVMAAGGVAVIIAISLIFLYLFYVVWPLFGGAEITPANTLEPPLADDAAHVALDEYAEIALVVDSGGRYEFLRVADGAALEGGTLMTGARVTAVAAGDAASHVILAGTADGRAIIARADYAVSYPDDQRLVTPSMAFPLGSDGVAVAGDEAAITHIAGQWSDEQSTVVALTASNELVLVSITTETSFLDDEVTVESERHTIDLAGAEVSHLVVGVEQRELYVATTSGELLLYTIADPAAASLLDRVAATAPGVSITALAPLSGGLSVLVGDSAGGTAQWFPVRDDENRYTLARVRGFAPLDAAVVAIAPEYFRKAFAAIAANGDMGLFHTTAGRRVVVHASGLSANRALAMAPRADRAVVVDDGAVHLFDVDNEHPEVSWQALWGEVWYESRQQPEYIWQSSSASSDFEPKFSLTPLTFGTLKATFYSMLFAVPLAVLGAVYTAYFMTPAMRNIVKPSVEVMAALPTVILGFLAGLWLAPLIERELVGLGLSILIVPLSVFLASWIWTRLPRAARRAVPDGWEAMLLMPVLCLATWFSLVLGSSCEVLFFNGSLPHWLSTEYGITYDQRNSLVVGLAIGFAVIPTIFSISEDAVFSVPRSLTMGSLALGATPWQTALRVILLTASPGIFSAIMIGMGRAVGETMIVLMATGNTPIMDLNIFQGFRALSANIAVEMPESEVDSTHYRILFLAALVLFLVTFMVNTLAELVRQRLRQKYASL